MWGVVQTWALCLPYVQLFETAHGAREEYTRTVQRARFTGLGVRHVRGYQSEIHATAECSQLLRRVYVVGPLAVLP
jgi:hypothetical protein